VGAAALRSDGLGLLLERAAAARCEPYLDATRSENGCDRSAEAA
jgi:hypothetical protein